MIIAFAGWLDLSTVDRFRAEYRALFEAVVGEGIAAGSLIVLDLSGTDFVSIDATPALVEAKDLAARQGLDFTLVTTTRGVEHALLVTGVSGLLTCCPTLESAVGPARTGRRRPPRSTIHEPDDERFQR